MCTKVTYVGKSSDGTITHIGGSADDGSKPWGLSREEAIHRIESNDWSFFVARPAADPVSVIVRTVNGLKILTTARDDTQANNLSQLPVWTTPLVNTDPQFPLSLPGPRQPELLELAARSSSGNVSVISPDANGHFRITGWTTSKPLSRVRLTGNFLFPGDVEVYIERDPTHPDYQEAIHKLIKVDSTSAAQVRAIESRGQGWFDWVLRIPDSSYPRRFTPAVMPVGIPKQFHTGSILTLFIRSISYNRYCGGPSALLSVVLYKPTSIPPGPVPWTVGSGKPGKSQKPPREYKEGAFVFWQPALNNIGQSIQKGADKYLKVKSPNEVGISGWPYYGIFKDSKTDKNLCPPLGFGVLAGAKTGGGGIGFSNSGELGVALAVLKPHVPGYAGDVLFRFAKLGAPFSPPMNAEGFLATPNASVAPRILFDPAEQVVIVVYANRSGSPANPGRLRLLDLGRNLYALKEMEFDGRTLSASVSKRSDGSFEAVITTNKEATRVKLPKD